MRSCWITILIGNENYYKNKKINYKNLVKTHFNILCNLAVISSLFQVCHVLIWKEHAWFDCIQCLNRSYRHSDSRGLQCALEQCSDVWALSRSKATNLWKDQFELIFHERLSKTNRFSSFMTKSVWKFFLRQNLDFCGNYFLWPLWNWGFGD